MPASASHQTAPARASVWSRLRGWARAVRGRAHLRRAVRQGGPIRLVVGSGGIADPGWIATEVEFLDLLRPAEWAELLAPQSVHAILAEHVWEHLTPEEGVRAAQTCHVFLRPGGYLRLAVPDGNQPDPVYIEQVRPGGAGAGAHDHKVLYTLETLSTVLTAAGFAVEPLEYFDRDHAFHQAAWRGEDGLVRRSARHDPRNADGTLHYTSLLVDARKPGEPVPAARSQQ